MVYFKCQCGASFGIRNPAMKKWEFGQRERMPACVECGTKVPRDVMACVSELLNEKVTEGWTISLTPD